MVQIDWTAIGIIFGVVAAWSGLLIAIIKWLLNRYFEGIKERFNQLRESIKKRDEDVQRIAGDVAGLRTEMYAEFWRREDAVRQDVVISAKLDALAGKIEVLTERIPRNGP